MIVKGRDHQIHVLYCKLHFSNNFVSTNFQKRPCLEDSSWHTENTSNLEAENRLLSCTQPPILGNQLQDYNQPLLDRNSAAYNDHVDLNCNIVYRVSNCQEMDISYDSAMTRNQVRLHQQNLYFLFGCIWLTWAQILAGYSKTLTLTMHISRAYKWMAENLMLGNHATSLHPIKLLTPGAFSQKHVFGHFRDFLPNLLKKAFATWQHPFLSTRRQAPHFVTFLFGHVQKSKFWDFGRESGTRLYAFRFFDFFFHLSVFSFSYLFAAVIDLVLGCFQFKNFWDRQSLPWSTQVSYAGTFCSVFVTEISAHFHACILGFTELITLIWVSLERSFPPAELEYRWCQFWSRWWHWKWSKGQCWSWSDTAGTRNSLRSQ